MSAFGGRRLRQWLCCWLLLGGALAASGRAQSPKHAGAADPVATPGEQSAMSGDQAALVGDHAVPSGEESPSGEERLRSPAALNEIPALFPLQRRAKSGALSRSVNGAFLPRPDDETLALLIDELGANQYAVRERAAGELRQFGPSIAPQLRKLAAASDDPETRARAANLVNVMSAAVLDKKIAQFLAGDEDSFSGWSVVSAILGDSTAVRDLFVDLVRTYPEMIESLDGSPQDRRLALDAVSASVTQAVFVEQKRLPMPVDAMALLLPVNDPNVPMSSRVEMTILTVLTFGTASEMLRDPDFRVAAANLVGGWMRRTSLGQRGEVLAFALNQQLADALPLALTTLKEATNQQTVVVALQTIARFGSPDEISAVVPLLDDERLFSTRAYTTERIVKSEVRDAAMATIAILSGVGLAKVGLPESAEHPRVAFVPEEIGFDADNEADRTAVRKQIEQLILIEVQKSSPDQAPSIDPS